MSDAELSPERAAAIRDGAAAAVAAVTMQLDGAGHKSLEPLRHLTRDEQTAANSSLVVLLAAVLGHLGTMTGNDPGDLLRRFALGIARIEAVGPA